MMAAVATRVLATMFFGVAAPDASTLRLVAPVVGLASAIACASQPE
jgi:hypothetical protein